MTASATIAAYVRSPYRFEVREVGLAAPGPGELLLDVAACGVCGTDLHIADRRASEWQPFGHEIAGVVRAVGPDVTRFAPGDRVALDSSAPCGRCAVCQPPPAGRGRPHLCRTPATYWGRPAMGFSRQMLAPHQVAVAVPASVSLEVACLVEPVGVALDLVRTAAVGPGDCVLVVGPGPLGLAAAALARRAGAERVILAGRSRSVARLRAGLALGADEILVTDRVPLPDIDWGDRPPDRVLVTAPPAQLPEAIGAAAYGGVVAYIGIAFGPGAAVTFDADHFHFRKLSLRASHGSPGTHAAESIRLLETMPQLGRELISHRFALDDIAAAMAQARDDRLTVKKMVMVGEGLS